MQPIEDLDAMVSAYEHDPFQRENALAIRGLIERCARYAADRSDYLELGIGHGLALEALARRFDRILLLEGSRELVQRYTGRYPNVELVHTFFEDWSTERRWQNIGMGFILEHVEDPARILAKYRAFLAPGGSVFVGVPNARSLHRLLGQRMGLLPDLALMSDADRAFGHRRFLTYHEWVAMFEATGYRVVRAEGLYLKPLTTGQLTELDLGVAAHQALSDFAAEAPSISNTCFFQLTHA